MSSLTWSHSLISSAPVMTAAPGTWERYTIRFRSDVPPFLGFTHSRYMPCLLYTSDYPKEIKAFYMKMNPDNKTVAAVDCLVPGIGEIIGGSQREDNLDKLVARMDELGLHKEDYDFYLDLRKYGSTRHAGFGLGFERCVMYLTGICLLYTSKELSADCSALLLPKHVVIPSTRKFGDLSAYNMARESSTPVSASIIIRFITHTPFHSLHLVCPVYNMAAKLSTWYH